MRALLPVLIGVVVGCGGGSGAEPGAPLPADEVADLCRDGCTHFVECGWATEELCETECTGVASMWRGDGFRPWIECMIAAPCASGDGTDEICYVDTIETMEPRSVHDEFLAGCSAAATRCPDTSLNGCDLENVIMFSDPYMTTEVLPCFELACDALSACLETKVLDAF
jgi:hypothetical protein